MAYHTCWSPWPGVEREKTHLVEAVLAAVTDINNLDDFGSQPLIEHITLTQFRFEIRRTSEDETGHVNLVVRDEVLHG